MSTCSRFCSASRNLSATVFWTRGGGFSSFPNNVENSPLLVALFTCGGVTLDPDAILICADGILINES